MLDDLPIILILVGLCAYGVLAGADFGAGFWILSSRSDGRLADHARHSIGPVWEANHVWLIFIIVVSWTAYPRALASITSTLAIALLIGLLGIILRGAAYALRAQADGPAGRRIERALGVASILAPFALGAAAGGIASGHVPVGNERGGLLTSWLNPTGIAVGVVCVVTGWYLAAVYLAADAQRQGQQDLVQAFRSRALRTGVLAGGCALVALWVVRGHAHPIWDGLTRGWGIVPLIVSILAGAATMLLASRSAFRAARWFASLAVTAVIGGWGIAQLPNLLPGLTIDQAAASPATLVALTIALGVGALVLCPSLVLLFRLALTGRFDPRPMGSVVPVAGPRDTARIPGQGLAVLTLVGVGAPLAVLTESFWEQGAGILALLGAAVLAFPMLASLGADGDGG